MNFFQQTMQIFSALIMVYSLLIVLRFFLSWVSTASEGTMRIKAFIHRLTDPYMRHFHRISWLQFGMLDFSPILGLAILSFFLYITQRLSHGSPPSPGELLVWLIQLVWGLAAFLLFLFAIVMIIRLITLYTIKGSPPDWTHRLDTFLFPRVSRILGFFTHKTVSYPMALGISAAVLLVIRITAGWVLSRFLFPILTRL